MLSVDGITNLKQELVSWVTTRMSALPVTRELGLVLENSMMTPTRVETRLHANLITAKSISSQWVISWFSKN